MIVTVTPNPSIDRTIVVEKLTRGSVNRAQSGRAEAAGKGVNVSCALAIEGVATLAVLPLPIESAAQYISLLGDAVRIAPVRVPGHCRVNVTIVEADGTVTKVNEPGPTLSIADADALVRAADIASARWIVGCGSLPPGAPGALYARLVQLGTRERRIAVDSSGDALTAAIAAGASLVKPNRDELEDAAGCSVRTLGDVVDAARVLIARGCGAVLVSLGADGALFVDGSTAVHAEARKTTVVNTVGAGDALLAGFLAAGARAEALPIAVAWAVAAVSSPGTRMRAVSEADRANVSLRSSIDRHRVLAQ